MIVASEASNNLESRSDERSYMAQEKWFLYIIECRTSELYVGIAQDVNRRVEEHNKGRACRYTKYRKPVRLVHFEPCGDYTAARKRERQVKRFSKAKKLALAII